MERNNQEYFELEFELTPEELEDSLLKSYQYDESYEEWLKSDGFVEFVNGEINMLKPQYSESDVIRATRYASQQITIDPSEVGKEIYDRLFTEKIEEFLSLYTER